MDDTLNDRVRELESENAFLRERIASLENQLKFQKLRHSNALSHFGKFVKAAEKTKEGYVRGPDPKPIPPTPHQPTDIQFKDF